MKKLIFILLPFIIYFSQSEEHHHDDFIHYGIGNAAFYKFSEEELSYGVHLHFVVNIWENSGIGLGYEAIFAHDLHQTIDLFYETNLFHNIVLNIGPGIALPDDEHNEIELVGHIEFIAEYHWLGMHLGPMIGFGIEKHDSHISAGIHLGF